MVFDLDFEFVIIHPACAVRTPTVSASGCLCDPCNKYLGIQIEMMPAAKSAG
jgi:hypothetical protein